MSFMLARLYTRVLRWSFTRFYREFAWTYDVVAAIVSRGLWPRWITAVVPFLHGNRVLELGSGTGYLQRALHEHAIPAIGIDASWQMLRLAQRKIVQVGGTPRLARVYAQALPFPAHTFSDVVATFPAEYIVDPRTYTEIARVLRSGGQVLLVDAAYFTRRDAYTTVVEAAYRVTGQSRAADPRPALLEAAGFVVSDEWVTVGASRVQIMRGVKVAEA